MEAPSVGFCCRQIFGLDGVLICFSSLALSPQAKAETLATANTAASRAAIVFFNGISLCRLLIFDQSGMNWFNTQEAVQCAGTIDGEPRKREAHALSEHGLR